MIRVLIVTEESVAGLGESLIPYGFTCSVTSCDEALQQAAEQSPNMVFIEIKESRPESAVWKLLSALKKESRLPVIALVPGEMIDVLDGQPDVDDFVTSPYDVRELALRAKRLLLGDGSPTGKDFIKCGGLVIDAVTCEVTVYGRLVELTFKEYEMLKLLASHRGRVYTREALLDKVWGYDYFGGDRTVDVHIRRLRGKIEDSTHTFIETVRNIGYRFKKDA